MLRFLLAAAVIFALGVDRSSAAPPNFILILIDDLGWADFSCFGNQQAKTPHIDRLAAEGLRFTQFYVNSPICSPSRTALSTGQYPQRWRITSFLSNRAENNRRGMAQWLDPAAPMLARMLKQHGYATGHFGKWHMGGQRDVPEAPLISEYGFDESLTNFEGLGPRLLGLCDAHDGSPLRRHALGSDTLGRGPVIWYDRTELTAGYTGAAIQFIEHAAAKNQPFYVNLWPDDVHSPFFPPKDRLGDRSKRDLFHGVLETMDEQLGALFDYIRNSEKLRDNTLIVLCSDNGPEPGAGSAGKFRGHKGTLYEGGIRSPLIVWGPGLIDKNKSGHTNKTSVVSAIDIAPSILHLAGAAAPPNTRFDGENLATTLLGKSEASRQAPIHWRRPPDRPGDASGNWPDLAIREGPWKLLCDYDGSQPQLYNLATDASETTNLAATNEPLVKRLTTAALTWHQSLPPDNGPTYVPAPAVKKAKKAKAKS
jgi:uncharacterized sulfatase